jgi:hypothetical protein
LLTRLLSQALVAFTIELDNEFEHRMPHRTTRGPAARSGRGPWLVSWPMWANYLRHEPSDERASLVNLAGLHRWRYLDDDSADGLTPAGRRACAVWEPLTDIVEERWHSRGLPVAGLRTALAAVADPALPEALPVTAVARISGVPRVGAADSSLLSLLSRVLLAVTLEVERESPVSVALGANVLRVLGSDGGSDGVRVRDLPGLTGVSREAVAVSLSFLVRHDLAVESSDGRSRVARLTERGVRARTGFRRRLAVVEATRPGLAELLEPVVGPALAKGLRPYPDGWRAHPPYLSSTRAVLADPAGALPHQPMVSHRGGFPDGA